MLFDVCQFHSWASLGEPTLPVQCVFSWLGSFPLRRTRPCLCSVLATTVYLRPSSEEASGDTGWCFQRHLHRLWNYEHPEGRERLDGRGQGPHGDHRILQEGKRRVREHNHEPGEPPRETPCQFKTNKQQQWTKSTFSRRHTSEAASSLDLCGCLLAWFQSLGDARVNCQPPRTRLAEKTAPCVEWRVPCLLLQRLHKGGLSDPRTASSTQGTSMKRAGSGLSMIFF